LIWVLLFVAGAALASSYDLDPAHSGASFKVRHMMISNVHGKFTGLKGSVDFDPGKPSATTVEATIVTKPVVLDVETTPEVKDPWHNNRFGASATTRVNRTDFGLIWNKALETGGVLVGDDIDITLELELVKRKTPTTTD
jgi:polyisoprenoid-binding protein YceI